MDDMERIAHEMNNRHRYTVAELIEMLSQVHPDTIVVLSRDSEGNSIHELDGMDWENTMFIPDNFGHGEIKFALLTEEMIKTGYTDEDIADFGEGIACVVLYPR